SSRIFPRHGNQFMLTFRLACLCNFPQVRPNGTRFAAEPGFFCVRSLYMIAAFFDRITRLSLRFYWVTLALSLIIIVLGVLALGDLNQELLPRIEFPQTVIVVQWPDAESADQFLNEVTIPLEEKLSAVEGVVNVESTTSQ